MEEKAGSPPIPGATTPCALIVIDVQLGFDDASWGPANNPGFEANVARLLAGWREHGQPVVFVRHDSAKVGSPLAAGTPGNGYKAEVQGEPDLLITKQVHSAFYGRPDLDDWLQARSITSVAICGIATDHCCETTARMAGDLGYETYLVLDATRTFDRVTPEGEVVAADLIARATAASLNGEFATVLGTTEMLARLG
ncbi:MAG TPA: cysteine hydrolase family protein [Candidatus Nanopelagicaceae bacterium]|nr:cysteine hydrolase family protein [Candidatus Nanopelagicaceae bacterium]